MDIALWANHMLGTCRSVARSQAQTELPLRPVVSELILREILGLGILGLGEKAWTMSLPRMTCVPSRDICIRVYESIYTYMYARA